jgi:hypothetical protein
MQSILNNKILIVIVLLVIAGGIWWFIGYSRDTSFCEDQIKFAGTSQDGYYYNDWMDNRKGISRTRYESREVAFDACIKYKRR